MQKVLNRHHGNLPPDAIYIGRGTIWGNPFVIGKDGTREEVIEKYCVWILNQPLLLTRLHELKNKDLICSCAPALCHGTVLLELIKYYFGE